MAIKATKTEGVVDKATGLFKKGFATFDKMMFLEKEQQDSLNAAGTNFEVMNKVVTTNIEEIEESISKMTDVKQIKELRDAMERLKDQNMQDTSDKIDAGENVGIEQAKQFSKDLLSIKKSMGGLDTNIEISFDDMIKTYAQQITSDKNSDKAQDEHFRSLVIALNNQSIYLKEQVSHLEKQENLSEEQIALLESHKRDLVKINKSSEESAKYSKMGPEELKKNKQSIDNLVSATSNEIFESKMHTSFNSIDNSIQSLGVDSEVLNETMNDLTEAQMSGKDVIAGSATELKKGAKGMVSSMILGAMGLGGLDEALGISEKFSQLDLFGKKGIFGKGGLLSNINQMKGAGGILGGGLLVAGAGAAGYAFGGWLKKKIDDIGGEKNFLGSKAYDMLYGHKEEEWAKKGDLEQETNLMSKDLKSADEALRIVDEEIAERNLWGYKEDKIRVAELEKHRKALVKKKARLSKKEVKVETPEVKEDDSFFLPEVKKSVENMSLTEEFENIGVTPEEVSYLPKTMEDTTNLIIKNAKENREQIVKSQNQPPPIIIPQPSPSAPIDTSKSVDDIAITILNTDILG